MGHAGDANVRTPHMDRLAAEGVSFGRAYANCPVCTPSRGTIFSGRHAHAGPVQGFFDVFKATAPSTPTIPTKGSSGQNQLKKVSRTITQSVPPGP